MPVANEVGVTSLVTGSMPANPPRAVVGEEIVAEVVCRKLCDSWRVERAAGNGTGCRREAAVRVAMARSVEPRICGRAFRGRPAVIGSGSSLVDLFPRALADVVDEHRRPGGVECERERIAQPQRPDRPVDAGRGAEERVVGGNAAVLVHSQDLAETVAEGLRVRGHRILADRNVELLIGPEGERAAIMVGGTEVLEIEQDDFAGRRRDVAVGGEAADPVVYGRTGRRVVDVDELVDGKVGIERHAEQAALTRRTDGHGEKRRAQKCAVLDDAQPSALLADEEPAVGRELHRGGVAQAAGDERFSETGGQSRGAARARADQHQQEHSRGRSDRATSDRHRSLRLLAGRAARVQQECLGIRTRSSAGSGLGVRVGTRGVASGFSRKAVAVGDQWMARRSLPAKAGSHAVVSAAGSRNWKLE